MIVFAEIKLLALILTAAFIGLFIVPDFVVFLALAGTALICGLLAETVGIRLGLFAVAAGLTTLSIKRILDRKRAADADAVQTEREVARRSNRPF